MLIFPETTRYHLRRKMLKEKIKVIEETLRLLGNFEDNKPIEIKDCRYDTNSNDTIYIVKDLDSTIFEFYDYKLADSFERKQKNYQLTLKKVNSNFVYKYDFDQSGFVYDGIYTDKLNMIEVSQLLSENRIVRLEFPLSSSPKIKIEEKGKTYLFQYSNCNEEENIDNFKKVIENVKNIENLNVENLLSTLPHQKQISTIYIQLGKNNLAQIEFSKGIITRYEINEATKKTNVNLLDNITIKTESGLDGNKSISTQTLTEENYEKILKSDYKRLFKEL